MRFCTPELLARGKSDAAPRLKRRMPSGTNPTKRSSGSCPGAPAPWASPLSPSRRVGPLLWNATATRRRRASPEHCRQQARPEQNGATEHRPASKKTIACRPWSGVQHDGPFHQARRGARHGARAAITRFAAYGLRLRLGGQAAMSGHGDAKCQERGRRRGCRGPARQRILPNRKSRRPEAVLPRLRPPIVSAIPTPRRRSLVGRSWATYRLPSPSANRAWSAREWTPKVNEGGRGLVGPVASFPRPRGRACDRPPGRRPHAALVSFSPASKGAPKPATALGVAFRPRLAVGDCAQGNAATLQRAPALANAGHRADHAPVRARVGRRPYILQSSH